MRHPRLRKTSKTRPADQAPGVWGRRPGRNPPSVPSSIRLIGAPAPPAELIGDNISFHNAAEATFHPRHWPSSESPHHGHTSQARCRFCAPAPGLPGRFTRCASALWVEFPQGHCTPCDCSPAHRLPPPGANSTCDAVQKDPSRYRSEREPLDRAPHLGRLGAAG